MYATFFVRTVVPNGASGRSHLRVRYIEREKVEGGESEQEQLGY